MIRNFAEMILAEAGDEPIEAVVIGYFGGYKYGDDDDRPHGNPGRVLTWDEASTVLDYNHDTGYGSADCHAIYAWTPTRVLFVEEYDGATGIGSAPRNPEPGHPTFK